MRPSVPRRFIAIQVAFSIGLAGVVACSSDRAVVPVPGSPSFAKGGPSGNPSVKSTTPASAPQNVTLDVTVDGSGFEQGSQAVWALDGDTTFATTRVKTNSTTYVSGKRLIANITISADSPAELYDVQVLTLGGRKGIGIELFAVTFGFTDLGAGDESIAYGVSGAGQVAGTIEPPINLGTPVRAFVWTPDSPLATTGTVRDLGTLGGTTAHAKATNEAGQVVGGASDAAGVGRAFLWTAVGGMKDLGFPADATGASAWGMNDAGGVVGMVDRPGGSYAARWTVVVAPDGSVQVTAIEELGTIPGGASTIAFAINEAGQAVGWVIPTSGGNHPILWTPTGDGWIVEDLGIPGTDRWAVARDVNDAGIVVGYSHPSQGCPSAVVWTTQAGRKTGVHILPSLGGCGSEAYGVNNEGDVVGRSTNSQGVVRATLWKIGSDGSALGVTDLGASTPSTVGFAYDVSARVGGVAQVGGFLRPGNGAMRATLWRVQ